MNKQETVFWLRGCFENQPAGSILTQEKLAEIGSMIDASVQTGGYAEANELLNTARGILRAAGADEASRARVTRALTDALEDTLVKIDIAYRTQSRKGLFNKAAAPGQADEGTHTRHYACFSFSHDDDQDLFRFENEQDVVAAALQKKADCFKTYDLVGYENARRVLRNMHESRRLNTSVPRYVGYNEVYTGGQVMALLPPDQKKLSDDIKPDSRYVWRPGNTGVYEVSEGVKVFNDKGAQIWPKVAPPVPKKDTAPKGSA